MCDLLINLYKIYVHENPVKYGISRWFTVIFGYWYPLSWSVSPTDTEDHYTFIKLINLSLAFKCFRENSVSNTLSQTYRTEPTWSQQPLPSNH